MGRLLRCALGLVVTVTVVGTASPASAGRFAPGRFGVGDSIMLSAAGELANYDIGVNAEVGRQFSTGLTVVERLVRRGVLPRVVVVHLGTNGTIDPLDCDALIDALDGRLTFLVTVQVPRPWEEPNNRTLHACASRHERTHVIRWGRYADDHPEWFADDGYHLTAEGQAAYASLIDAEIRERLSRERTRRGA